MARNSSLSLSLSFFIGINPTYPRSDTAPPAAVQSSLPGPQSHGPCSPLLGPPGQRWSPKPYRGSPKSHPPHLVGRRDACPTTSSPNGIFVYNSMFDVGSIRCSMFIYIRTNLVPLIQSLIQNLRQSNDLPFPVHAAMDRIVPCSALQVRMDPKPYRGSPKKPSPSPGRQARRLPYDFFSEQYFRI